MSAVFALLGAAGETISDGDAVGILGSMAFRGAEERKVWREPGALLAVARDGWEMDPGIGGRTLVASLGTTHVVSDATLYYKSDLRTRIEGAGIRPASDSSADLIAAAYAAFGPGCVDRIEGDFAFCVLDSNTNTLFCARDPFGSRSLFHMEMDGTLFVASTSHALVKLQGADAAFDPTGVLRSVLMRYGDGTTTAWKGVRELPAGHLLRGGADRFETRRFWVAQGSGRWEGLSAEDTVPALAEILEATVKERELPSGTALAMSGGMDSTALLASLTPKNRPPDRGPIHILSIKFPEGDPGNEDWYVNLTADFFDLPVHWVEIADLRLFDGAEERARIRSNCHGHIFERHNRGLAGTARNLGGRVLLNGHGGDNVFAVGDWEMADLLRKGRWLQVRRYLTQRGYRGAGQFFTHCLRPALPFGVFDLMEPVLGRSICSRPVERPVPPWVNADRKTLTHLTREDRRDFARNVLRHHASVVSQRRAWALMDTSFHRACAALFDLSRDEGVELRMPFYDKRLVEFVMSRPAAEFNQPRRHKVLLERAMRGRLPDRSRKPQPGGLKPGTAVGIMQSRFGPESAALVRDLSHRAWISEALGIVDPRRFTEAFQEDGPSPWRSVVDVSLTLFAEIWLRAHGAASGRSAS